MKLIDVETKSETQEPIDVVAEVTYTVELDAVAVAYLKEAVGKTSGTVKYSKSRDLGVDLLDFFNEILAQEDIVPSTFFEVTSYPNSYLTITNK